MRCTVSIVNQPMPSNLPGITKRVLIATTAMGPNYDLLKCKS